MNIALSGDSVAAAFDDVQIVSAIITSKFLWGSFVVLIGIRTGASALDKKPRIYR